MRENETYSQPRLVLLQNLICVRLPTRMLREPDKLGFPIDEANHRMLPIPNMISYKRDVSFQLIPLLLTAPPPILHREKAMMNDEKEQLTQILPQHNTAPVEREEVEIKHIHDTTLLLHDDHHATHRFVRLPIFVGHHAFDPSRDLGNVFVGGEVDVLAFLALQVQLVDVVECQRARRCGSCRRRRRVEQSELLLWGGVGELGGDV